MMGTSKIKKIDLSQIHYKPLEGEIIQDSKSDKFYMWHENEWHEFHMDRSGLQLGLYDMNKQIIAQLPNITNFDKKVSIINALDSIYNNTYYLLYGKELSYFTLFKINNPAYFGTEVIDCLKNIGSIKAIDTTEAGDAIEIWVNHDDIGPTCLYLFAYDNGLVYVGE